MAKRPPDDEFVSGRDPGTPGNGKAGGDPWGKWDDADSERLTDANAPLDVEAPPQFLRAQRPVPVRRGPLPSKTMRRLRPLMLPAIVVVGLVVVAWLGLYYGRLSARFRLESSDQVQISGTANVTRDQVLEVFGPDISRNLLAVPLAERKVQLERIPWVESATVMRLLPDTLRVNIKERTPVAVVQLGTSIALADRNGVVMEMSAGAQYAFPVIVGLDPGEPISKRAASLRIYTRLMQELDSGGANYSRGVDEVDISDPEDVRIIVTDNEGSVLLHLGSSQFLERYKLYIAHLQEWRQQFHKLESVDLRYSRQVVLNPDQKAAAPAPAATADEAPQPAPKAARKTRAANRKAH